MDIVDLLQFLKWQVFLCRCPKIIHISEINKYIILSNELNTQTLVAKIETSQLTGHLLYSSLLKIEENMTDKSSDAETSFQQAMEAFNSSNLD